MLHRGGALPDQPVASRTKAPALMETDSIAPPLSQEGGSLRLLRGLDYKKAMEWASMPRTPLRNKGSGSERRDPMRVFWAENTFRSMASPIYQSKLLRRMVNHPGSKSESAGNPESSSVEPHPIRSSGTVSRTKSQSSPQYQEKSYDEPHQNAPTSPYTRGAQFERQVSMEAPREERRRMPAPRPLPPLGRGGEVSSYKSFSGTGRESVRVSKQNMREGVVRDDCRSNQRPKSRPFADDGETGSSQEEPRPNPRRVSFAKH